MATFMDMLNQGLEGLNTPVGMLGTQLLANSGPMPGNPGGGARLGQAFVGMQQQQYQQQQMLQQQQLRKIQEQEIALRARGLQRQENQQQTLQNVLSSPEAMQNMTPMQRQLMMAGVDPADIAKINPQAKQATPPGMYDEPQADGTYIRKVWDPAVGGYKASVPFTPPAQQTANVAQGRLSLDQQSRPLELGIKQQSADASTQNAQTAAERVATQQAAEQRQQDASVMEKKYKRLEFKQAYRGAVSQFDESQNLALDIANSKALPSLYGPNGYIPPIAGSDAADLQSKIDRLKALGGLTELTKLAQNGVKLTPVSNTDLAQAQTSAFNPTQLQSDTQAKQIYLDYAAKIQKAKDEAATRYNEYDSLYDPTPVTRAPSPGSAPSIADDAGYNALPSGAEFIGPDGVRRRKP